MTVLSPGRVARILADAARYRCIVEASELAALAESHERMRERLWKLESRVHDANKVVGVQVHGDEGDAVGVVPLEADRLAVPGDAREKETSPTQHQRRDAEVVEVLAQPIHRPPRRTRLSRSQAGRP
jgi:hypothetical protein